MSDQPDFTENTDLSAVLSPEDLADMEARMAHIASRPALTPEQLGGLAELRAGSQARIAAAIEEPGDNIAFDLSTPQGHIDAVTYVRTCLLAIAYQVEDGVDQVAVSDLFSEAEAFWNPLPAIVQFNVMLDFLFAFASLYRQVHPEGHDE